MRTRAAVLIASAALGALAPPGRAQSLGAQAGAQTGAQAVAQAVARLDSLAWAARTLLRAAGPSTPKVYVDTINAYATIVSRMAHTSSTSSIAAAAHWRRDAFAGVSGKSAAVDALYRATSECCLTAATDLPDADVRAARTFMGNYVDSLRALAQQRIASNLKAFEKKYGPTSPRLSVAEVGLNYLAQRLPGFRPNDRGAPSPLELVANYAPDYLTMVGGKATGVTAGELGVRYYFFGDGWGSGDGGGMLRPGYASFGVAASGGDDGAFQSVWRGRPRFGAFVAWGNLKVAGVGLDGRDVRWLVTRQFQKIPWVF